ncbi:PAS domain-containing protein [Bdellovibrio bacteriovorus]|uniref:Methyl-accepting chemotaxis protein n=1 Tax=Bdellovibrio bacteriovorus str. Tiberius TaxID=1069642 RepID=K7YQU6_BDEBC|nr:PAS domain-containing protein [Bdellovibrio bacteriovorus]AFX99897.1 methyl-accepting chemotaxis protein [Bdellovibrio bacteriovorus str. Tiberius]
MTLEADFALDELFFSKTDFKGRIESGNQVFVRVSEYSQDEILGRPHNIIRHQDMPRSVFKLFWNYLQSNKPIAAFVKNKSRTGKYYWVFAMAFPMADGYLSIRLKPTSVFLGEVQKIYTELVSREKTGLNMEQSEGLLLSELHKRGFNSYDAFMTRALLEEMKSRDQLLLHFEKKTSLTVDRSERVGEMQQASGKCTKAARTAFDLADSLNQRFSRNNQAQSISDICREVQMVTTNLTISAAKLGEAGKTLSVVSKNLERLALEIAESSREFDEIFANFSIAASRMYFSMATSRLQIEMMNHLIEETQSSDQEEFLLKNCDLLKNLISANFADVEETAKKLINENKSLNRSINMLSKVTAGMDVICVVGKIEMSRVKEFSSALESLLGDMENLTASFKKTLRSIENESQWGLVRSSELKNHLYVISQSLRHVDNSMMA